MEHLLSYFTPEKYQLHLKIDKHKKTRQGTVVISGRSHVKNIEFHCVSTEVDYVNLQSKSVEKVDFELEDGVLTLSEVPSGVLTLEIGFHGSLNENMQGAYLSTYKHQNREKTLVSTQFESHYARECFPCIDEPAAKAVFELSISIPEKDKDIVISNMPIKNVVKNTTFFEPTPRMST